MQVILQLLKEFWLPLLLAIGWTAFNVVDKPSASWTVREVLNIFGPTFFRWSSWRRSILLELLLWNEVRGMPFSVPAWRALKLFEPS